MDMFLITLGREAPEKVVTMVNVVWEMETSRGEGQGSQVDHPLPVIIALMDLDQHVEYSSSSLLNAKY